VSDEPRHQRAALAAGSAVADPPIPDVGTPTYPREPDGPGATASRSVLVWVSVCVAELAVITVAIVALGPATVPFPTFAIAPMTAMLCLRPARRVAAVALAASALAAGAAWAEYLSLAAGVSRIVLIAVIGGLATYSGWLRIKVEHQRARLQTLVDFDAATGLQSKTAVLRFADRLLALRPPLSLCIAVLDIDRFKWINDTHGHLAGDEVLSEVAARLLATLRRGDLAGRFGGDEIVIVLPGVGLGDAMAAVQRASREIAETPVRTRAGALSVSVSAGVSVSCDWETSIVPTLARADAALYRAKRAGRNRVEIDCAIG